MRTKQWGSTWNVLYNRRYISPLFLISFTSKAYITPNSPGNPHTKLPTNKNIHNISIMEDPGEMSNKQMPQTETNIVYILYIFTFLLSPCITYPPILGVSLCIGLVVKIKILDFNGLVV